MLSSGELWELRLTFDRQAQKRVSLQLRDKPSFPGEATRGVRPRNRQPVQRGIKPGAMRPLHRYVGNPLFQVGQVDLGSKLKTTF